MLKMNPDYKATFFDEYVWNSFVPPDHQLFHMRNAADYY